MTETSLVQESREVLAHHAKSFRWASVLLPRDQANDAAIVYAFCRLADDAVDEAPDAETARREVEELLVEFENPKEARPLIRVFVSIIERCAIPKDVVRHLFDGLLTDLDAVRIDDDEAILYGATNALRQYEEHFVFINERFTEKHAQRLATERRKGITK